MVALTDVTGSNTFWGVSLHTAKFYTQTVVNSFHVSMAALLPAKDQKQAGPVSVMLKHNGVDFLLCTLIQDKLYQQPLDLNFSENEEITLYIKGNGIVHLTGYIIPDDFAEEDSDDDDDSDDEDYVLGAREEVHSGDESSSSMSDEEDGSDEEGDSDNQEEGDDEEDVPHLMSFDDMESDDSDEEDITPAPVTASGKRKKLTDSEKKRKKQKNEKDAKKVEVIDDEADDNEEDDDDTPAETPSKSGKKRNRKRRNKKQQPETPTKAETNNDTKKQPQSEKKSKDSPQTNKSAKNTPAAKVKTPTPMSTKKRVLAGSVVCQDTKEGHGPKAKMGKMVHMYYAGKLPNGKQFDSTLSGKPFKFKLGKGEVIKGWDVGIEGMKVGGTRKLTIPAKMAYGNARAGEIPPNSTLIFDVELKAVS